MFVHSGLDGGQGDKHDMEAAAVFGQMNIHQKIKQLNFRNCRAKIRQIDSYETLGNGIMVQVVTSLHRFDANALMPGDWRAVEQQRADAALHADLHAGPAQPQELLRPQRLIPLPGQGDGVSLSSQ
jgi:hypothetical protein